MTTTSRTNNFTNQPIAGMVGVQAYTALIEAKGNILFSKCSSHDPQNPWRTDDLSIAMDEQEQPAIVYRGGEREYLLPQILWDETLATQPFKKTTRLTDASKRALSGFFNLQAPAELSVGGNTYLMRQLDTPAVNPMIARWGVLGSYPETLLREFLPDRPESSPRLDALDKPKVPGEADGADRLVPRAYENRIETLKELAPEDGITVREASVGDFGLFMAAVVPSGNAQLVLMDNGNLRAVWKEKEDGIHLALQFLGNRQIEYVVFKRFTPDSDVSRFSGVDSFNGIRDHIMEWGLIPLVSA